MEKLEPIFNSDHCSIWEQCAVRSLFNVYLHSSVEKQAEYVALIDLLRNGDENDSFVIYLNNRGGSAATGIDIINAMKHSHSEIVVCLTGPIYSMAPLIALSADKIFVEENSFMMFHDYSSGMSGKGHEQKANVLHTKDFFDELFNKITKGFLSAKEQKEVNNGKDLYINNKETIRRLKKMGKLANE